MNTIQRSFNLFLFTLFVFLVVSNLAHGQAYNVYTVADTGTQMPTRSIAFGNMNSPVAITSIESEAFFGTGGVQQGIYQDFGGTLDFVANQTTPVPGNTGNFTAFTTRPISIGTGPDVAFAARSFGRVGMYTWVNGVFNLVSDSSMNLPGVIGANAVFFFRPVHLSGNDIAFVVSGSSGEQALYAHIGGTLELVADTGTPIPGGTGNFTSMTFITALDDNTLIFLGEGSGGQKGYYAYTGGSVVTLVDTSTPIPDGVGNFTDFSQNPEPIGGADFAFKAFGSGGQSGIYSIISGVLDVILDENDFYPGSMDNYSSFCNQPKHVGAKDIVCQVSAFGSRTGIIQVVSGVVTVAVDNTDPIPGGIGTFSSFDRFISLGTGQDISFEATGSSGQRGIYTLISGTLGLVVDRNTLVPGGSGGTFGNYSFLISLGDGDVGFRGGELGTGATDGVYNFVGGTLNLVANNFSTPVPGSFGIFLSFSDLARIPGTKEMSFAGFSPSLEGVYTHINLTLGFVADNQTLIPGGNVPGAMFRRFADPVSLGNDDVAFFADGTDLELGFYSFIGGSLAAVADLNTAIPSGAGNFISFPQCTAGGGGGGGGIVGGIEVTSNENEIAVRGEEPPLQPGNIVSPSDGNMAFLGAGTGGQIGIYSSIGGVLGVIADTTTAIPGGTGNFTNYTCVVSLHNGEVAFLGAGSGGQSGIYATSGGSVILIADLNTPVPGGIGNYTAFGMPVSIDNGNVAFLGSDSGFQQGIYRSIGGVISTVADFNTTVPGGGGNFNFFLDPVSIADGDLTFTGFSSISGVYTYIDGVLDVLVNTNDTIPDSASNFTTFGIPAANPAGDIAFRAFGSGGERGIYASVVGNLFIVSDNNSPIPGGVGNFTNFNDVVALTGRDWAFRAQGTFEQIGIYNAVLGTGSLTILKETNPPGGTDFGFEGTNLGMQGCSLDGSFTLDDQGFITCDLIPGSYTVQETDFTGYTLSAIDCVGAASFSTTNDSVTVDLELGEIAVCTFTNTQHFVLNPVFPALDDNINFISAEQAQPNGRVAFLWALRPGSYTVGGQLCNGLELGLRNPKVLGVAPTNQQGVSTYIFYIPFLGDFEFEIQLQAVDINTCRESNVLSQIIRKEEGG